MSVSYQFCTYVRMHILLQLCNEVMVGGNMCIHICPQSISKKTIQDLIKQSECPRFFNGNAFSVTSMPVVFSGIFYTLLSYTQVRVLTEAVSCLGAPSRLRGRCLPVLLYTLSLSLESQSSSSAIYSLPDPSAGKDLFLSAQSETLLYSLSLWRVRVKNVVFSFFYVLSHKQSLCFFLRLNCFQPFRF